MISVANVSKYFGQTTAVDDISFEVLEGENLILLGTSGCGKTTTLKMINRLAEPSKGAISVNGESITSQSPEKLRRGIGYVLQHNSLFPHYTVSENIAVVPLLLKWDKEQTETRTKELLQKLHLSADITDTYPNQLSGGQQQRVNIARALAADPPILLMDEPFGALDTITRTAIRKEFSELDEFKKKTILMVTHDVQEAFELGDRICLMDEGKIMQIGTPAALLFHPANGFVKDFLAEGYLQLAFKTTKLSSIWNHLDNMDMGNVAAAELTDDPTIWAVMEQMINTNNGQRSLLSIRNKSNNEVKQVSWEGLLVAFNQYKINSRVDIKK